MCTLLSFLQCFFDSLPCQGLLLLLGCANGAQFGGRLFRATCWLLPGCCRTLARNCLLRSRNLAVCRSTALQVGCFVGNVAEAALIPSIGADMRDGVTVFSSCHLGNSTASLLGL